MESMSAKTFIFLVDYFRQIYSWNQFSPKYIIHYPPALKKLIFCGNLLLHFVFSFSLNKVYSQIRLDYIMFKYLYCGLINNTLNLLMCTLALICVREANVAT